MENAMSGYGSSRRGPDSHRNCVVILARTLLTCPCLVAIILALGLGCATETPKRVSPRRDLTKADVEKMLKSISNWGRWGADDELGTINLITPQKRREAANLVTEGTPISLAHNVVKQEIDDSPAFVHAMLSTGEAKGITYASDEYSVRYHGFTQTHMDALCHIFYEGQMYNGFSHEDVTEKGAGRLSVVAMKQGIFTRGVIIDIPRLLGKDYLDSSRAIYPDDLDRWERQTGIRVTSGDAVVFRTGRWARREARGGWEPMNDSSGLHVSCLPWLRQRDVAIVGSDLALDVMPSGIDGITLPVHLGVLVFMGMPILDNLDLEALGKAAHERGQQEFLLTVAPLAVEGGTGSPVNPIATF